MAPAQYYVQRGMRNLQVSLPRELKVELARRARARQVSLRVVYEEVLAQFIQHARSHKSQRPEFRATRRLQAETRLQMWLAPELDRAISRIARHEGITKRAVAATALTLALEYEENGRAANSEAQTATHRRRRS